MVALDRSFAAGVFRPCEAWASLKNYTFIRYDILVVFRNVFDLVNDKQIRLKADRLMAIEEDLKYGKNYATAWRKNKPSVFGEHSTIASGKCRP